MINKAYLLQLTIPSVQKFIGASRKSIDLWIGSFLISNILKEGLNKILSKYPEKLEMIFPHENILNEKDTKVANISNKVLFIVKGSKEEVVEIGSYLENYLNQQLKVYSEKTTENFENFLKNHGKKPLRNGSKDLLSWQINSALKFIWGAVPLEDNYTTSLNKLNDYISYIKSSETPDRRYIESYKLIDLQKEENPFNTGLSFESIYSFLTDKDVKKPYFVKGAYRCTVCGERSILEADGDDYKGDLFWRTLWETSEKVFTDGERLCGVCLLKRFYQEQSFPSVSEVATTLFKKVLAEKYPEKITEIIQIIEKEESSNKKYFSKNKQTVPKLSEFQTLGKLAYLDGEYLIPQVWETDEKNSQVANKLNSVYKEIGIRPSEYFSVLLMDGDSMGAKLSKLQNYKDQKELSKLLSEFTKEVKKIVESNYGELIYAGGDDVLAFLPVDTCLDVACKIQKAFKDKLKDIQEKINTTLTKEEQDSKYEFSISAGIVFAHHKLPLNVVLEKAKEFEQKSKNTGKNKFTAGYIKPSLASVEFSLSWKNFELVKDLMAIIDKIPNTFIYQLYELAKDNIFADKKQAEELVKYLLNKKLGKEKTQSIMKIYRSLNEINPIKFVYMLKVIKFLKKEEIK